MEFTALFLAVTIVMLVAWRGPRALALALFAATLFGACPDNPVKYELLKRVR
jgi:hypothetical protein